MSEKDSNGSVSVDLKALCDAIAPFRDAILPGAPPSPEFLRAIFAALVPAVTIPTGEALLGNKARSVLYNARDAGRLKFVKDGNKTLIVTESIFEYQKNSFLPFDAAKSKMPPPSKARQRKSRKQGSIGGGGGGWVKNEAPRATSGPSSTSKEHRTQYPKILTPASPAPCGVRGRGGWSSTGATVLSGVLCNGPTVSLRPP